MQKFGCVVVLAAVCVFEGCRGGHSTAPVEKTYPVRGRVVATNPADGTVMLAHEAIPGLMEAMTMPYRLAQPGVISELHAGDRITATLHASQGVAGPENFRLDQIVVVGQARPDTPPAVQYHVPAAGDAVPDFVFRNQSGKTIHLAQFRGKVVALTFVYARCPLADYCPRMSRNFAAVDKGLAADPKLYAATHLLTLSFDPEHDTPEVLRSYARSYTQQDFAHWDFAVPPADELGKVAQFFDLGITPGESTTLNHSLSTVVIGKDGKVIAFYPGNDWTAEQLLAQMKAAA
jgi:protein SCO1/2